MSKFIIGLDLGQAQDYTALSVIEYLPPTSTQDVEAPSYMKYLVPESFTTLPSQYHCRHLARYELGTRYPDIVDKVAQMLRTPQLQGATLIVDATGVGRPVVDMFVEAGMDPVAITITGGDTVTRDGDYYRVPKRDLVASVQVLLQNHRLKFAADMPLAPTLIQEMINFKVKITDSANDTYGTWREGVHDDLILAVMLVCWWIQEQERKRGMSTEELQALMRWWS
jgi:hypothetical protein